MLTYTELGVCFNCRLCFFFVLSWFCYMFLIVGSLESIVKINRNKTVVSLMSDDEVWGAVGCSRSSRRGWGQGSVQDNRAPLCRTNVLMKLTLCHFRHCYKRFKIQNDILGDVMLPMNLFQIYCYNGLGPNMQYLNAFECFSLNLDLDKTDSTAILYKSMRCIHFELHNNVLH